MIDWIFADLDTIIDCYSEPEEAEEEWVMAELPKYFYFRVKSDGLNIQIEDASDTDVAEVVRCKDCKHHEDEEIGMVFCPNIVGSWVNNDWFCRDGEAK